LLFVFARDIIILNVFRHVLNSINQEPANKMLKKIISGGQTGADRAALDAALERKFPCGGWCPAGRIAEDGPIPAEYPLMETPSKKYEQRTEKNVIDSDATLIITSGEPEGGTALTVELARRHKKPCIIIDIEKDKRKEILSHISEWLRNMDIEVLNVAGPRKSKNQKIYPAVKHIIKKLLNSFRLGED
jgi:predicted Rossmann fold nucleotide-binding protein DprA/Smf involved in DNA uptake